MEKQTERLLKNRKKQDDKEYELTHWKSKKNRSRCKWDPEKKPLEISKANIKLALNGLKKV